MAGTTLDIYLHDGASRFRIALAGTLAGAQVSELENAWTTASSILGRKQLLVDLARLTHADEAGLALLDRLEQSGATLVGRDATAVASSSDSSLAAWFRRHAGCPGQ